MATAPTADLMSTMTAERSTTQAEAESETSPGKGLWSGRRKDLVARGVVLIFCLLLSAEALAIVSRWRANRDRLGEILRKAPSFVESSNLEADDDTAEGRDKGIASRRIAFEHTPHHAKLVAARTLVYQALAFGRPIDGSTSSESARVVEQLSTARELAQEVLKQQPNNWQASMFLGAATYLDWSLRSDARLFTAAAQWETPLLQAMKQAAGKSEPRRFLVAAYLETWAALSAAKKDLTHQLVTAMFREDSSSFVRLGPVWFEVAGDQESALDVIPDLPHPWNSLKRSFAEKKDWDSFCLAHDRYVQALKRKLSQDLEEAEERLRLGDTAGGRQICLSVVVGSPRDGLFADQVKRALELYPPGLRGLSSRGALNAWLSWALELHEIGVEPFGQRVIGRLADAIGDLDSPAGALAALIADDAYRINRYERLTDSKHGKEWAPFLISRSRWLVDREELDAAADALREVHRSAQDSVPYWMARRKLALATGDLADLGTADEQLAAFRLKQWRASDWRWRGRRVKLKLYPESEGSGLRIDISKVPKGGAVVNLIWDGKSIATRPVVHQRPIEVRFMVEAKPHLLELRSIAGGEVHPGPVTLLD